MARESSRRTCDGRLISPDSSFILQSALAVIRCHGGRGEPARPCVTSPGKRHGRTLGMHPRLPRHLFAPHPPRWGRATPHPRQPQPSFRGRIHWPQDHGIRCAPGEGVALRRCRLPRLRGGRNFTAIVSRALAGMKPAPAKILGPYRRGEVGARPRGRHHGRERRRSMGNGTHPWRRGADHVQGER